MEDEMQTALARSARARARLAKLKRRFAEHFKQETPMTYDQLRDFINRLSPEQLKMEVVVEAADGSRWEITRGDLQLQLPPKISIPYLV